MVKEEKKTNNNNDWFTEEYSYKLPHQGEVRDGILLEIDEFGALVDVGLKHDGVVPRQDIERLEEDVLSELEPGQKVKTRVVRPQDREGNLVLSLSYLQEEEDWARANTLLESEEVCLCKVIGHNRGGLLVKFGTLTGFVPSSHIDKWSNKPMSVGQCKAALKKYEEQELSLKVMEVDRDANRLILSERLAARQIRDQKRAARLREFSEGQVCQGVVSKLVDFGAFVDLDGIEGLLHVSELAWRRVKHPSNVLEVDQEISVYILNIDYDRNRISLSLKRLQPNPWENIDELHTVGQLVSGTVTNVVKYGTFVLLDSGIEGLLHVSEIADPPPDDPREFVTQGEKLMLYVLQIDPYRQRIGLSLKRVPSDVVGSSVGVSGC